MYWFHSKCQSVSKATIGALNKWHGTLVWLCDRCTKSLKLPEPPKPCHCSALAQSISELKAVARHNANVLCESIQNQEKLFTGQCKLIDKLSGTTIDEGQRLSYAEAVKGVGDEVVEKVAKRIEKLPAVMMPVKRSHEEVAGLIDEIQDKERRKLNLVIHNLPESEGQSYATRADKDGVKFKTMIKEGLKLVVETTKNF